MKSPIFLTMVALILSLTLFSCRDVHTDPTTDVVEDFDKIMQNAEDEVKEVIIKDSNTIAEKKIVPIGDSLKN